MWTQIFWYIFTDIFKNYDTTVLRVGKTISSYTTPKMEVQ